MTRWGDETGLVWQDPVKETGSYRGPPVALPETNWTPPQEFPNLTGAKRLGFDVETKDPDLKTKGPGVRRPGNHVCGYSLSTEDKSWYFPTRHEGGGNLDSDMVTGFMRDTIGRFTGELYGANLQYDLDWGMDAGIDFSNIRRFVDVTLAEPLLDENLFEYNLEAILTRRYGEDGGKTETVLRQAAAHFKYGNPKTAIHKLPARFVGEYAEADAFKPIQVYDEHLRRELEQQGLSDLFDLECRLLPMLVAMRRRGVRVAPESRIEEVGQYLRDKSAELQAKINDAVGFEVNLNNAGGSLITAFDKLGLEYPIKESTKNASFQKPWLQAHPHWFPRAIAEGRKWEKVHGTFVTGHLGQAINGRIHCEFNQLRSDDRGAISGRFSSSNPNLQNIPSRDPELGPLIRSLFIPEDGHAWWRFDWSQIEYRLLAHYAVGESGKALRNRYNTDPDVDFHKLCGEMAKMDATNDSVRKRVKNVNFGVVYGAGVETTAITMGVSIAEAEAFLKTYHEELPFAKATQKSFMAKAARRGYIYTLLKRRRRFPLWEPASYASGKKNRTLKALPYEAACAKWSRGSIKRAFTYSALNGGLQGGAADLMKKAMVDLWEGGLCADDVLGAPGVTVHDELGWSAGRDPRTMAAIHEVKHIMETCLTLKVPIRADVEYGRDWGHMEGKFDA